jgi:membrane associated rhomboid family serine protease
MMCGTPVARPAEERRRRRPAHADPETLRFLRAIISRPATFTFAFIVANVFVYLLMYLSGGAKTAVLLAYGAKLNYLIDERGQWWRFVTPIFLHVQLPMLGPLHLLSNMYGLFMLGPYVEKLYGSARFVVFWILTGIAGVVASYLAVRPEWAHGALGQFLFKPYDSASAGASGALFGLMGVLFVFGIKYGRELPEGLKRAFGTGLLPTLAVNLFIGYVARGFIDNAAHLGGLLAGMALALPVGYKRPGERGAVAHAWHLAQAACLALVVVGFAMVARNFDAPSPRLSNITRGAAEADIARFVQAINDGQTAMMRFVEQGEAAGLAPAVERLEKAPRLSPDADALREDLAALLGRARDSAGEGSEPARARLASDFREWQDRFDEWVKDEGREFRLNIQRREPPQEEKK